MGIRKRGKCWHYRFNVNYKIYSGSTGLEATKRNENAARRIEAKARQQVLAGKNSKKPRNTARKKSRK